MVNTAYPNYINATSTLDGNYDLYIIDATDSNIAITLPPITMDGISISLKRKDISNYTVTVQGNTSGETIENTGSVELNQNSPMTLTSYGLVWHITHGNYITRYGMSNELQITFESSGGYRLLANNLPDTITHFLYRGSNYYGSQPIIFKIACGSDSGSINQIFTIILTDTQSGQIITTISDMITIGSNNIIIFSTGTFSNVPTEETIIRVEGYINTLDNPVRLYSIYLQLN